MAENILAHFSESTSLNQWSWLPWRTWLSWKLCMHGVPAQLRRVQSNVT